MSSATIHPMPELDPTDRQINRTVRGLLAIREMTPPTFMARAGITKGTYYNRLRGDGGGWTQTMSKRLGKVLPPPWTAHCLRHAFATDLYARTLDLAVVAEQLGHKSTQTTERYVQVRNEKARAAVAAMTLGEVA